MKKYKIFLLALVALVLAFCCFTGFVSVPTVRAEYEDGMFPPFTDDNFYVILDFTNSNIPLENIGLVFFGIVGGAGARLDNYPNVGAVYLLSFPKSLTPAGLYTGYLDFVNLVDLEYIGFPSFGARNYFDINNNSLIYNDWITPNLVQVRFESPISYCVIYINNPLNTLRDQYDNLSASFRTQQIQLINETSRANQAEANYNNLLTQYNSLNTQYSALQGDYEALENLYEEARDNAEHYQGLLREANAEIDELSTDNDRLQGIINNLPPTDLAFGWVGSAFATVDSILSIEIIPNLTIGSLVLIPLVLGVLFFVLRLVRGE